MLKWRRMTFIKGFRQCKKITLFYENIVSESSVKDFYKARNNEEEFNKKAKSLEGGYSSFRGG